MSRGHVAWSRRVRAILAAALLAGGAAARAGTPCDDQPLTAEAMTRAMTLAEHVQRALDASGAQVVIVARAGQDLRKYGLQYSHLAFAYRESIPAPAPPPAAIPGTVSPMAAMGDPAATPPGMAKRKKAQA